LAVAAHDLGNPRLLVDELKDVRRVNEDADRASNGHRQEDEEL